MDGNGITMAEMVTKVIAADQLSAEEEIIIKKLIEERQKKRGGQKGRCLAGAVGAELMQKINAGDAKTRELYQTVYQKCFERNRIGRMDSFKLSESVIKKYQGNVIELYGLSEDEIAAFIDMFQSGLEKLQNDGILGFTLDENIFYKFSNRKRKVSYINNPYSADETERIMGWVECHPVDARGLAVGLWFTGGIALSEIVKLSKKDCWGNKRTADSGMQFDEGFFNADKRSGIVTKSLDLHPRKVEYVFVVPRQDGSGWKRLTEKGLQRKLAYICQELGIVYKKIDRDEAIKINRQG